MDKVRSVVEPYVVDSSSHVHAHELAALLGLTPVNSPASPIPPMCAYRCQLGLFGYGLKSEGLSRSSCRRSMYRQIRADVSGHPQRRNFLRDVWAIAETCLPTSRAREHHRSDGTHD